VYGVEDFCCWCRVATFSILRYTKGRPWGLSSAAVALVSLFPHPPSVELKISSQTLAWNFVTNSLNNNNNNNNNSNNEQNSWLIVIFVMLQNLLHGHDKKKDDGRKEVCFCLKIIIRNSVGCCMIRVWWVTEGSVVIPLLFRKGEGGSIGWLYHSWCHECDRHLAAMWSMLKDSVYGPNSKCVCRIMCLGF